MSMFLGLIRGLSDLLYPKICLSCKERINPETAIDELVCKRCWQKIARNNPPFCHLCGRQLKEARFSKGICGKCLKKKLNFDRAFSPCLYEGVLKQLIHEFKYRGKTKLAPCLSKLLLDFIKEYGLPVNFMDFIIPMPLHKARLRQREFNQAALLSGYIAREFNKPMLDKALLRSRNTKTQTELKEERRFSNVKGSFSVKDASLIKDKNLLLIDDVLTTAATASEASGELKKNGANIVFVLTLAS